MIRSQIIQCLSGATAVDALRAQSSNKCQTNLNKIKECCEILGIPLALEQIEGPSTFMAFFFGY